MEKMIQYCTNASLFDGDFIGAGAWPAAGMGYVFVSENNRLIVVDGGHGVDAEALTDLLTEQAGGGIPSVDLWIVTHPHGDHYGALQEIAAREDLRKRINVKKMVYYFPEEFRSKNGKAPCGKANRHMESICQSLGTPVRVPTEGERIRVDSLELTFLFVPTDCSCIDNPNSLSLIFTVQGSRRRVMMTGDAFPDTLQYCVEHYGEALQCDILQLPHHGLCDTGYPDFYRLVNAKVLFDPISKAGDEAMKSGFYGDLTAANLVAEEMAEEIHYAYEGTLLYEF